MLKNRVVTRRTCKTDEKTRILDCLYKLLIYSGLWNMAK